MLVLNSGPKQVDPVHDHLGDDNRPEVRIHEHSKAQDGKLVLQIVQEGLTTDIGSKSWIGASRGAPSSSVDVSIRGGS